MANVPVTNAGLDADTAIKAGEALRKGWDILRSLQGNKTASILRYTVIEEAKPHLGIEATTELVPGLSDLDVYVTRVSTREVMASGGKIEMSDMMFIFYAEVKETDEILYGGVTYRVISLKYWDEHTGRSMVIARAV